ncbi:hypothetical protein Tco_1270240 [Tanacetum coccineum]
MTDYERNKLLWVQENQERLRELGVKNITKSLTSLAVAENTKKRQKKDKVTNDKDVEYNPEDSVDNEENYQEVATHVTAPKKLVGEDINVGSRKITFINLRIQEQDGRIDQSQFHRRNLHSC